MDKIILVQGKNIQLTFTQHKVKLANNDQLAALLAHQTVAATDELIKSIKKEFQIINDKELNISDASMAVEIWGHVYAEDFAAAIKQLSTLSFIDNIAEKIIDHCEIIDIGEAGHDSNRFIWDRLASFKSMIAKLLPAASA